MIDIRSRKPNRPTTAQSKGTQRVSSTIDATEYLKRRTNSLNTNKTSNIVNQTKLDDVLNSEKRKEDLKKLQAQYENRSTDINIKQDSLRYRRSTNLGTSTRGF